MHVKPLLEGHTVVFAVYLVGSPDAFHGPMSSIDESYVDGLSITHGSPRQHVWTFAASHGTEFGFTRCP